jgi:hypothetical protein
VKGPTHLVELHNSYHMVTIDREHRTLINETVDYFRRILQQRANPVEDTGYQEQLLVAG